MEMWGGGIVAGDVMVTVTVTVTSCDLVVCESGYYRVLHIILPIWFWKLSLFPLAMCLNVTMSRCVPLVVTINHDSSHLSRAT